MRFSRSVTALALLCAICASSQAFGQDFDPNGRHHHPPPRGHHPPTGHHPPVHAVVGPQVLIDRYTKIVLAQPGSPFPLQRLAQLYREKDGNLKNLVADFEKRAAASGAQQYAATVTLAGIYKVEGRVEDAISTFEKAIPLKPADPAAVLALAHAYQDRGDVKAARARFEQALPLQKAKTDKEQTLRTLMTIALDAKDWPGASGYHQQLVKLEPTSLYVKGELGRELYSRGEYEKAEAELETVVKAATGDNRALAPALKDLGRAQAKAHENQKALATLKRALQVAGQAASVRTEIFQTIAEIYRADQQLPVLIKQLEDEHASDFGRLRLLGSLYEETGDAVNAIATYKRALARNPRDIDMRLKMVRLLQSQGELDKAITEYEGLIRAAPNNPQFVFEECDALLQRGDRARALKLLGELEARAQRDEDALSRLADFYGRIGEAGKSMKVLQRLATVAGSDPTHLVDLGDRYYQDGNTAMAMQTWKRILTTVTPRARALAALGEVYLEHDMTDDALTSLREATKLDPSSLIYKKQLASALERKQDREGARVIWEQLAQKAKKKGDKILMREARRHIVTLWGLERVLEQQLPLLAQQFNGKPPDVEAGRTLAEAQIHLRKLGDAEKTLRKVIELAPGDEESYLALERVLVQGSKLQEAIAVLQKLVTVQPKRARELYSRMAQYAMQLHKDDDAVKYAARAVELNPDDAIGHQKLGKMYQDRQDIAHAIVEYRAAIAKNDRLFPVYFDLAKLLLSKGQSEEADRLYRRIVRGAPDDELVGQAVHQSMSIEQGKGSTEPLEQDLLPLAIGNPQRTIYRRSLVTIYGNLTFPLVQRVRRGEGGKEAAAARAELARIGARAVKPLLDTLADGDETQQKTAIDMLAYVQNKNAGPALFSFATGTADQSLRIRAMVACGALGDPGLIGRYRELLFPKAQPGEDAMPSDPVAVAAVWGLARMNDKRTLGLLRDLAQKGTPEMRALAVLGLGQLHDKASVARIADIARSPDAGNVARAGAAYALGDLGAEAEAPTLLALAQGTDPLPRELALVALARMGARKSADPPGGKAAIAAMADAVFAGGDVESSRARQTAEALQHAGAASLVLLANPALVRTAPEELPVPDDLLDVEASLAELVPKEAGEKQRAAALVRFAEPLQHAALSALETSGDRARSVLDALGTGEGTFQPFVQPDAGSAAAAATKKAKDIAQALEPAVVPLARHPSAAMRTKAIVLLAHGNTPAALAAVVRAVDDQDESVQRVALSAMGARPDPAAVTVVARLVKTHPNWAMRVLGAQALGRLGAAGSGAEAARALRELATKDSYALVREAALVALASYDKADGAALARQMSKGDPEPRVRETALRILR